MAAVTPEQVMRTLEGVRDPELGGNVVELGMISDVSIEDGTVDIGLALTIAECPMRNQLEGDTRRRVAAMPGVETVNVRTTAMTKRQRAELMSVARRRARENAEPTQVSSTTRVIAIASGKGGVGKSSMSANLAAGLANRGFAVGLLDADIWGFSVPRMMGATGKLEADATTKLIQPVEAHGVKVVSTGLIIESEETALMWRGLMLSKALEQFLKQVDWGDLDYLILDMPPGTGDVQMALTRMLPQAEMVVVTTPQPAAQRVAIRVADMARRSHMPVVGVIENMAGDVFGSGGGKDLADELGVPLLASIPLDQSVVSGGDNGTPVILDPASSPAGTALEVAVDMVTAVVPPADLETCTGRIAKLIADLEDGAA
ncbi:MAG TPA: Mrp/NBP35 family ATP-binding protein [Acidimicrobiia bacterium]|nr:Mrp/NBP35 family ATP-binding protein [Acidimicrobiia bacterium]